jgi:hypothetical protein
VVFLRPPNECRHSTVMDSYLLRARSTFFVDIGFLAGDSGSVLPPICSFGNELIFL